MDEKISHFWNSCPLKLEYLPTSTCHLGSTKNTQIRCQWWINSEPDYYCFWTFIKNKSDEDGDMSELLQVQISKLLGINTPATHTIYKKAIEEFIEILNKKDLLEEFRDSYLVDNEFFY